MTHSCQKIYSLSQFQAVIVMIIIINYLVIRERSIISVCFVITYANAVIL